MFDKLEIKGDVLSEKERTIQKVDEDGDVISEETVQVQTLDASKVVLECNGEKITLKGKITELIKSLGVANANVRVEEPGKAAFEVTSLNSEKLKDSDGSDKPFVEGTNITPVYGGKAF